MHTWKARLALSLAAAAAVGAAIASIGPARAEVESILSCDSIKPCLQWNNSGSGDSIKGISTSGVALEGQTKFKSAGKTAGKSGVLGSDVSTTGTLNSGVSGSSINGTGVTGTETGSAGQNGVAGFSSSTFGSGVYGQNNSTGAGVAGSNTSTSRSNGGAGLVANATVNDGIHSFAGSGNAVYAFSQSGTSIFANQGADTTAPELYLQDTSSSKNDIIQTVGRSGPIFDVSSSGQILAYGNLRTFNSVEIAGDAEVDGNLDMQLGTGSLIQNAAGNLNPTVVINGGGVNTGSTVFRIGDHNSDDEFLVTDRGNTVISGEFFSQGPCITGCVVGNKRVRAVTEYSPTESEPTIEDNGEATLAGGSAYVALDPKFANVINSNATYLVTATPEGDCRGLYIDQRSARGFAVHELQGGHSSVGFSYRIVAKRYGVQEPRLPMTTLPAAVKPVRRH